MKRIKRFFTITLLGGFMVILPVAILVALFNWVYSFVSGIVEPITDEILKNSNLREISAEIISIFIIITGSFLVGLLARSNFGKTIHEFFETRLFEKFPGYTLIRETLAQFIGNKKSPFTRVALVKVFGNDTMMTGFITDEHDDGSYTVFVPTGPNPTSGNIYHLQENQVTLIQVPVEDAMRSIISCGAGSTNLIETYRNLGKI